MFGGVLPALGLGFAVGRLYRVEAGIASGLLLWGLGNLAVAAGVALFIHVDSTVVSARLSRCEPLAPDRGRSMQQQFFRVPAAATLAAGLREISTPPLQGLCAEDPNPTDIALRVRKDDLRGTAALIPGEAADDDKPVVIMVLWSIFGGAGSLIGGVLLASTRPGRRPQQARPAPAVAVAPWRRSLATSVAQLGLMIFVAAWVAPWFLEGSTERSLQFGFRCAALALACWFSANIVAGSLTWGASISLLGMGGVLLGLAEVVRR